MSIHSSHIFLFPFSFIDSFDKVVEKIEYQKNWLPESFEINNADRFNQHVYFHDYAEAIFFSQSGPSRCYRSTLTGDGGFYYILCNDNGKKKLYELRLTKITLYIFNTHIGVLSFFAENNLSQDKEDILKINEYGRRLFPQFLTDDENKISACQGAFLPLSMTISSTPINPETLLSPDPEPILAGLSEVISFDDFRYFKTFNKNDNGEYESKYIKLPGHIMNVLGESIFTDKGSPDQDRLPIKPVIDDRMFVMCCMHNEIANRLKICKNGDYQYLLDKNTEWTQLSQKQCELWSKNSDLTVEEQNVRKNLDFWYRFIFVDKNESTCQSVNSIADLLKKHSYDRWINWGTLYGVSRYSFMILTASEFEFNSKLKKHFANLYYYLALLSIVERASVLQFSQRVTDASKLEDAQNIAKKEIEQISTLYYDYINFINRIYLREVTAQEQGIELYNLLMDRMNIKEEIDNLDEEISELHTYVSLVEDSRRNRKMAVLNNLAVFFLPASLIAAIMGIGFIDSELSINWYSSINPTVYRAILLIASMGGISSILIFITIYWRSFNRILNQINKLRK